MITTEFILLMAVIVFLLMMIGIVLSIHEFERLNDESERENARERARERQVARAQHGQAGRH